MAVDGKTGVITCDDEGCDEFFAPQLVNGSCCGEEGGANDTTPMINAIFKALEGGWRCCEEPPESGQWRWHCPPKEQTATLPGLEGV